MNANHPEWQQILDTLDGSDAPGGIREHLHTCDRCSRLAARLQELLDGLALARGTRPPAALIDRAVRAVMDESDPWGRVRAIFRRGLEVVRATPVTPVPAPLRGKVPTRGPAPHMLLFEAPAHTITLSLASDPGGEASHVQVRGQIVPRSSGDFPPDARVFLVGSGEHSESALSPFGEFNFRQVRRGPMHLAIEVGTERLEMGPFGEPN